MGPHYLDRLLSPSSIAVFGASDRPESVGARVLANILAAGFRGGVYPINPKHEQVQGRECYRALDAVHEPVDLAVIATPAATVPRIVQECGEHGVRAALVLSAGFESAEGPGAHLLRDLLERAQRYGIRILGPNCLGLIRPEVRLNATFSKNNARQGHLALVSQSGALCTAILDWAEGHGVGFSAVVSTGDAADVDFGDLLDYLAMDPTTHSILLYVEGIHDARGFMSGLRSAARLKPVIVLKAGRHAEGSRAAVSHTGALVGADDVFDAALQRAGVVRATTIEQLFSAAQLLAVHRGVRGRRLAIVTNGGGPGVMATDRAIDLGMQLAELSDATVARLDAHLPAHWPRANPVDILGDADAERYRQAVHACLDDPDVDGALVMLTPQAMTDPDACAAAVIEAAAGHSKPVLTCWMGEPQVEQARRRFTAQRIATFPTPEASVEAFSYLANYHRNQQLLMQVPGPLGRHSEPDLTGARLIIEGALEERRTVLSSAETRAVLAAFRIPVMQAMEARSANEALVAAESVGFPVALKINSPDIVHKSDVNGVRLNVADAHAVRSAYNDLIAAVQRQRPEADIRGVTVERMYQRAHGRELLVGVLRDPVFGPVISFGAGGTAVEVVRDRAVALPPLNSFIAANLINRTRVSRLLASFRNLPAIDLDALQQVLRRVSEMVCELPRIYEMDINPLVADENGAVAVDARIVLTRQAPAALAPYAHMAIHPYPAHLVTRWQLAGGTEIVVRPIRPEDAEIEQRFVRALSPQARYFRFMQSLRELSPEMLIRFTQIDYDREMALIAVLDEDGSDVEVAVTRYTMNPDGRSCEFAIVVADAWQHKGIGSRLLRCLMEAARDRGLQSMEGEILADNQPMLRLITALGFTVRTSGEDAGVRLAQKAL